MDSFILNINLRVQGMWLLVLVLTIVLWLILDNVLVAAMLAIFALFLFTTTRALWLSRREGQQQKLEVAVNNLAANEVSTQKSSVQMSGVSDLGVSDLGVSDLGMSGLGMSDLGMSDLGMSDLGMSDSSAGELDALGMSDSSAGELDALGINNSELMKIQPIPQLENGESEVDESYLRLVDELKPPKD